VDRVYRLPANSGSAVSRPLAGQIYDAEFEAIPISPPRRRRIGTGAHLALAGIISIVGTFVLYLENRHQWLKPLFAGVAFTEIPQQPVVTRPDPIAARGDRENVAGTIRPASGPLPTSFGVYAVSGDQLFDLGLLQGRAADSRIAVSATFNFASKTTVPDGKVRFIVYRRDWANDPPDRAEVRIVAKLENSLTHDSSGKANVASAQGYWVIRNIAFSFHVGPIGKGEPGMFEIHNDDPNFALPPGRYAPIVKSNAYDFLVQGIATDTRQCLQRVEALDGTFYHECRLP
jgi:hypothetical protein